MTKEIIAHSIGGDGGTAALGIDGDKFAVEIKYPIAKVLEPVKAAFVDKLKALIPGTWDDVLIDGAWAEAMKLLGLP